MPKKVEECVKSVMEKHGYDESKAWAICQAEFKDHVYFSDAMPLLDGKCVSIRDGVMQYLGAEIGMEPASKVFMIYRSPDEVKRVSNMIKGVPITRDHVDTSAPVPESNNHGRVNTSNIVKAPDPSLKSTIAVQHDVSLSDNMLKFVQDQKPELSLGYTGSLIPHDEFDFEQVGIMPHHLAIVSNGRCGEICSFKDSYMNDFLNEDGSINLDAIKAVINSLKEAIDKADAETVNSIMEEIKSIIPVEEAAEEDAEKEMEDEESEVPEGGQMEDEEMNEDEKKEAFADADKIKDKAIQEFKKSKGFKDSMIKFADERIETIMKAKQFLNADYKFMDKCNIEIMRAALIAAKPGIKFNDAEIPVAFKMLEQKHTVSLKSFGDNASATTLKDIENKELN